MNVFPCVIRVNPSVSKESACNAGDPVRSLGGEDPLEKGMATHSGILAWRILWTEGPGGLQSVGSQSQTQLKRQHACTYFNTFFFFFLLKPDLSWVLHRAMWLYHAWVAISDLY